MRDTKGMVREESKQRNKGNVEKLTYDSLLQQKQQFADQKKPLKAKKAWSILYNVGCIDAEVSIQDVTVEPLSGGVLNTIFLAKVNRPEIVDGNLEIFQEKFVIKMCEKRIDPNAVATDEELHALQKHCFERGGPVPKPLGRFKSDAGQEIAVMAYLPGRSVRERDLNDQTVAAMGHAVGVFHKVTRDFPAFKKKPSDAYSFFSEVRDSAKRMISHHGVWRECGYLKNLSFYGLLTLTYPSIEKLPSGPLHGDLHPGNFIQDKKGRMNIVDFDLCYFGPYVKDLANAICMLCFPERNGKYEFDEDLFLSFMKAYHAVRPLEPLEIELLHVFLRDRGELEQISNGKLDLLDRPPGTAFNEARRKVLAETLNPRRWESIRVALKTSLEETPEKIKKIKKKRKRRVGS